MLATLELRKRVITGNLAGRPLCCFARPPLPGSEPAAGLYHIQPPVHDVIYGLVAVMVPVVMGTAGAGTPGGMMHVVIKSDRPGGVTNKVDRPGGVTAKLELRAGITAKVHTGVTAKISDPFWDSRMRELPGGVSAKLELLSGISGKLELLTGSAPAFVLSGCPVPGRRCLVIQSNFADLMDALRIAGGAAVRVA